MPWQCDCKRDYGEKQQKSKKDETYIIYILKI